MKSKKLFLFIIMLLTMQGAMAQTNDLSKEDMTQLLQYTQQKVNQFNGYVSFIAKKQRYTSQQQQNEVERNKDAYIREALKLFIGKGEDYTDEYGNKQPAPEMQVSSIRRNGQVTVKSKKVSEYLKALKGLNYKNVTITSGDAFFCSEARQIGEGKYVTTLSFRQYFIGERDGRVVYRDKTDKTVTVYIERKNIDGRAQWTVLLGNIEVKATDKY